MVLAMFGVLAWWSVSIQPRLSLANRLTFGLFVVKVYWPEIVFATLVIGLSLIGHSTGLLERWKVVVTRRRASARSIWTQLPRMHRFGLIVLVLPVLLICAQTSIWHVGRMMDRQVGFLLSGDMMRWFREDLLRLAVIEAQRGDYDAAVNILNELGGELRGSEQGDAAQRLHHDLRFMVSDRKQALATIQDRQRRLGITRQHAALQRFYLALLPQGEMGSKILADAPELRQYTARYADSLRRLHAACRSETADAADARTVGEAISALGYARNPEWLAPNAEPAARQRQLCKILNAMTEEQLVEANRRVFSVNAKARMHDWRQDLDAQYHRTSGWIVLHSLARAADLPMAWLTGSTAFTHLLGPRPSREAPKGSTWSDEQSVLAIVQKDHANKELDQDEEKADPFEPLTVMQGSPSAGAARATVWFELAPGRSDIVLCNRDDETSAARGIKLETVGATRFGPVLASACSTAPPPLHPDKERALGLVLLGLLSKLEPIGPSTPSALSRGMLKSFLCSSLVASATRAPQNMERMVQLCPREALASAPQLGKAAASRVSAALASEGQMPEVSSPTSKEEQEPKSGPR